jgi:alpha-tubulin suppressor-like RCC1 family protein
VRKVDTDNYLCSADKNFFLPTLLAPSTGLKFKAVFTGPMACHTMCITADGKCFAFGRNDKGQLGVGDCLARNRPAEVKVFQGLQVSKAAVGKNHTLFLTSIGDVWAAGSNAFGQLGLGKVSDFEDRAKQIPTFSTSKVECFCFHLFREIDRFFHMA